MLLVSPLAIEYFRSFNQLLKLIIIASLKLDPDPHRYIPTAVSSL